jgi:myxalamid-type nonribosomal peptide synthetase MxaA
VSHNHGQSERVQALSADRQKLLTLLLNARQVHTSAIRSLSHASSHSRPLSWSQQRLWFIAQMDNVGAAYNTSISIRLRGSLNHDALQTALDEIVRRHEILRTVFTNTSGEPRQQVSPDSQRFHLTHADLSSLDLADRDRQLRLCQAEESGIPFDLQTGPLARGRLLRIAPCEHLLLLSMHHIICDGWSFTLMIRELSEIYSAQLEGRPHALRPLAIQYGDYAQWQREQVKSESTSRQLAYWIEVLKGAPTFLDLPSDLPRPKVQGYRGRTVGFTVEAALTARLNSFARRRRMTLFMVLYGAWAILLAALSGQDDVVVGAPIANRRRSELEALIGCFVNTVALRVAVPSDSLLTTFFDQVRSVTLAAYDNQDVPFEHVVDLLRPDRMVNRHPLFQTMIVLQNVPQTDWTLPELTVNVENIMNGTSKLDLVLSLEECAEGIIGYLNYDTDLFEKRTIDRWISNFVSLLTRLDVETDSRIGELAILSEAERQQVTALFNATQAPYPRQRQVDHLFEGVARHQPDAIAVVSGRDCLTYAELNRQADAFAHYLVSAGARAGDLVPVLMPRSLQLLVAQLGILKSRCAFVPIDPTLPAKRQAFILHDCAASLVVGEGHDPAHVVTDGIKWIEFSEIPHAKAASDGDSLHAALDLPAYVMYTSGSTGTPKGVVVSHSAVIRLAINNGYAQIDSGDCIPHYSNPAFDASTFEVWCTLLNGAKVVIVPTSVVLDITEFKTVLSRESITILWMSVGLFNQYTEALAEVFSRLRYLLVGGDSLEPGAVRRVLRNSPPKQFLNVYGPTECTTFSTKYLVEHVSETSSSVPIGQPISNAQIYILNTRLQVVPIGATGEIYIGGAGLAYGYLNRPALTAERFVADPFSTEGGARLYRTGDLGRWSVDGSVQYQGRSDLQIKLRGFRIELGEIEVQLARHHQIKDAVVVAREDVPGQKKLVAYVTPRSEQVPTEELRLETVRAHLQTLMPEYMIPTALVVLDHLPLTTNGKVNRKALPAPTEVAYATQEYEEPQGEIEPVLARIWRELLGIDRVSRRDNFFDLGGNSLMAIKALFRVNQSLGNSLRVTDLYQNPTVRGLAEHISSGARTLDLVNLAREACLDPSIVPLSRSRQRASKAILLTGSTGFVGRFLLSRLLQDSDATVFCLVRAESEAHAFSRIKSVLSKWDLWSKDFETRIVAVSGDLRLRRLGIAQRTYDSLLHIIDSIYHCGTSMNHLESYSSAKLANVESTKELLSFAASGNLKTVNYISTLSVFNPLPSQPNRVVDEQTAIELERHSTANGYAASKWVSEKIFEIARDRGFPCNIFRLGLVWADSVQGRYDELQREHRLLKTCLLSGYGIKSYEYPLTPTPVDYVARSVVLLGNRHYNGSGTFHICSGRSKVRQVFEDFLKDTSLELLSEYQWIRQVKRLHDGGLSLPAVPLVDYAFSMDECAFLEHQQRIRSAALEFDCSRTQRELEDGGIFHPEFSASLLRLVVDRLRSRELATQSLNQQQAKMA